MHLLEEQVKDFGKERLYIEKKYRRQFGRSVIYAQRYLKKIENLTIEGKNIEN
jgi:hypothetical protein